MIRVRRRPRHSVARGSEMAGVAVTSLKGRISHGQQRIERFTPGHELRALLPRGSAYGRLRRVHGRLEGRGVGARGGGAVCTVCCPLRRGPDGAGGRPRHTAQDGAQPAGGWGPGSGAYGHTELGTSAAWPGPAPLCWPHSHAHDFVGSVCQGLNAIHLSRWGHMHMKQRERWAGGDRCFDPVAGARSGASPALWKAQ